MRASIHKYCHSTSSLDPVIIPFNYTVQYSAQISKTNQPKPTDNMTTNNNHIKNIAIVGVSDHPSAPPPHGD